MTRATMTVIAVCSTLLWAGAVHASNAGGLPACKAKLAKAQKFPATGQTTSYAAGDDGTIKAGAALSYTDNGDGTITDNNTKLMWEKKDQVFGGLHYVSNTYPWSKSCQDGSTPCGTTADCSAVTGTPLCTALDGQGTGLTIFGWVAQLNAARFAGHTDWRIPNSKELQSIVDYGTNNPAVATAFNTSCSSGCSVTSCSCTQSFEGDSSFYWSATTLAGDPTEAFFPDFQFGGMGVNLKSLNWYVRAVRSGL